LALFSIAVDPGELWPLWLDAAGEGVAAPVPPDELLPHAVSVIAKTANTAGIHFR
jgi:hypothetical protein